MERRRIVALMGLIAAVPIAAVPTAAGSARVASSPAPQLAPQAMPFPQAAVAEPLPPPTIDEIELAFASVQDRMTVPVRIGAQGPWRFIVDTGAERTVVARELAAELRLPAGPGLRVTAMTDTVAVRSVHVADLSVDTIRPDAIHAPMLESRDLGALGLLGIDALQGRRVVIDFDTGVMTIRSSRRRRLALVGTREDVVVTARSLYGQLIVTNAEWRGKRIAVIVDTGSPMSIGNSALFALMRRPPRALGPMAMTSATGGLLSAPGYVVDDIGMGGVSFQNLAVAHADVVPFRRFGLTDEPALLLGMNGLRMFRRVDIDFANRAIRLTLPRSTLPDTRMRL